VNKKITHGLIGLAVGWFTDTALEAVGVPKRAATIVGGIIGILV
jgi:putative flippase GtrA